MHTQLVLGNTKQETKQGEGWREMGDVAQAAWSSKAPERRHSSEVRECKGPEVGRRLAFESWPLVSVCGQSCLGSIRGLMPHLRQEV